jgi:type 1 fimbria pilin
MLLIPGLDRSSAVMRKLAILGGCILPLLFLIGCRQETTYEHTASTTSSIALAGSCTIDASSTGATTVTPLSLIEGRAENGNPAMLLKNRTCPAFVARLNRRPGVDVPTPGDATGTMPLRVDGH